MPSTKPGLYKIRTAGHVSSLPYLFAIKKGKGWYVTERGLKTNLWGGGNRQDSGERKGEFGGEDQPLVWGETDKMLLSGERKGGIWG